MKKVNISTRVEKDLFDWIKKKSEDDNRSISNVINIAIKEYKQKVEKENG